MAVPNAVVPTVPVLFALTVMLLGMSVVAVVIIFEADRTIDRLEQQIQDQRDYYKEMDEIFEEEIQEEKINEDDPDWVSQAGDPLMINDIRFGGK